jgi:hypothetical protein
MTAGEAHRIEIATRFAGAVFSKALFFNALLFNALLF